MLFGKVRNLKPSMKVQVIENLGEKSVYRMLDGSGEDNCTNGSMERLRGQVVTISRKSCGQYEIEEDGGIGQMKCFSVLII